MGDKLRIELYIQLQLLIVYKYTQVQLCHKPSPSVKVPAKTQTVKNII